ncbi:hypothetical protein ACH5RR_010648 [Cinchona calisaya]|uniref:FLZ-type domain-containing protein n=1 Tax=Cinchona calisaya TaxID=153742 RepID=A0ABD3AJK6_9GENT
MTDNTSQASPTDIQTQNASFSSSFLGSPRIFSGFLSRSLSDSAETAMSSPTSILDSKPVSNFFNPLGYYKNLSKSPKHFSSENKYTYEKADGVGLAIIDSLTDEKSESIFSKPNKKMVLFGAKLKVQIPPLPSSTISPVSTPKSPADFGIKTRNSHLLGSLSVLRSPNSCIRVKDSPGEFSERGMSLSEMELSEDYTCVITHGPNPKTTHIFDDCVVENCCGVLKLSEELGKQCGFSTDSSTSLPVNFLGACYSCKDNLGDGKDIFTYGLVPISHQEKWWFQ